MLTYKQAYDKIIDAYFKDEIKPYDGQFCFCGTLNNNDCFWSNSLNYNISEFKKMEFVLLNIIRTQILPTSPNIYMDFGPYNTDLIREEIASHPKYEDALFAGMCAALDVLKEIHRSRGEDVDETLTLTKRSLQTV